MFTKGSQREADIPQSFYFIHLDLCIGLSGTTARTLLDNSLHTAPHSISSYFSSLFISGHFGILQDPQLIQESAWKYQDGGGGDTIYKTLLYKID